ncbi:hypothetical protein AB0D13_39130 [Streptomyces sp. NPDC048430]|uniref:hypothetical protein n=1 Tax=Streptomyces sp. NPDC048430 TaxID=3155388 RepID=UPI0034464847
MEVHARGAHSADVVRERGFLRVERRPAIVGEHNLAVGDDLELLAGTSHSSYTPPRGGE